MKCISKREKGRVHSLCLPFLLSICLTGVSYSFFTLYVILYFLTLYNIIMVENKDFILKGIVFVIHKFTDLYFLFFIINEITF